MVDFSITICLLPRYWKIGFAKAESDDLDEQYYIISCAFWMFLVGFTVTSYINKDNR